MRRRDFSGFLLAECALYFADAQGKLAKIYRPVPFYESSSARTLVEQLMLGPQPFDSRSGLSAVLPQGLRSADLLGVGFEDQTLLLNFSTQLAALARGMDGKAEARMVYALVNTLCELPGVRRAALFIQGSQPDSLAGAIYLPGDFLPNTDLIAE
jgi:germination protein M